MSDKMRIWDAVSKTDPKHTKKVNQRGGFTAISANYQIMRATETFGPIGVGWGYVAGDPIFHDTLCFVPVTLWHGDRSNTFGPMLGCEEWKDSKGRVDSDVSKKATTDALTKLLSQLGFNADVFLGLYDDNKYVQQVTREFGGQPDAPATHDGSGAIAAVDTPPEGWAAWSLAYQDAIKDCATVEAIDALRTERVARRMALLEKQFPKMFTATEKVIAEAKAALGQRKAA